MPLKPYDYDRYAADYDLVELRGKGKSTRANRFLDKLFRRRRVASVLDLACGTGAQAIGLAEYGYKVTASDLSEGMLKVARRKARGLGIRFRQGDMAKPQRGKFDAVIAMFNAVGHLSPKQLDKTMKHVAETLDSGGLFVLDVFNYDLLAAHGSFGHDFIDIATDTGQTKVVRFNRNSLDRRRRVMRVRHHVYVQQALSKPQVRRDSCDLQLYTAPSLREMLDRNGFSKARLYGDGFRRFDAASSLFIVAVATKD